MTLVLRMTATAVDQVANGDEQQESIKLLASIGADGQNSDWSKWTPSGQLAFTVTNPDALGQLEAGREYNVTITPVDA
jgi:hypothetical protein